MKQKIRLTKSEQEVMDILWVQQEALTSSEIIKAILPLNNTPHFLINN